MSQQPGRPLPNYSPVFRRPVNLDIILEFGVPKDPAPLSSKAIYVVCVENDHTGRLPAEKDFTIQFFGYLGHLGFEENQTDYPVIFEDVIENIRNKNGAPTAQLTFWATSNLATPADRITSDEQLQDAVLSHLALFRQDPLNYSMFYLFVEVDGESGTISSASNREYIPQPFLRDEIGSYVAAGGVSPRHVFTTGDDASRIDFAADETVSPNERPVTPPVQPKRSNTFESGKKAMSKLTIAVKNAAGSVKDLVSPRSAPEQHTVLIQLASGIEEEDYLTSLLPTTSGRPEHQADINDYQAQMFERFARFFPHIDPRQHDNTRSIHFRHTSLSVTPHQFCRAMEILFQDQGLAGGFLASEMGSGKSHIILCAVVARALLFQSKRVVEREWEEAETRMSSPKKGSSSRHAQRLEHLPRDAPSGQGLTCPTQRHRGNDCLCFCVPDGATRREISALKPGAALIQVPSAAMPGWIEILEGALFSRIAYNVTVLYAGPRLSSRLQPGPDFLGGTRFNRFSMGASLPEGHPGGLITDTRELDWFTQPAPLSDRSTMALETYIVVTSNTTRLRELFSWDIKDLSPAPQNCQFPPGGLYAYPLGIMFIDEAHKVLDEKSAPLQMAREHRHIYATPSATRPVDVWLVTGTPFGAQLKDLAAAVSFLAPDRAYDARGLHATYEAIKPAMTNTPREMFETLFEKVFGGQLVIRDDANTTFLGSRVSDVQKVRPHYVSRNTPESQLHSVRMLIDTMVSKGPRDAYFDTLVNLKQNTELLYLLSMFPSAARLLLETKDVAFTDLDVRRTIRKEKNTAGESLTSHKDFRSLAEKLTRGPRSPKLQYILDELERMAKDVTPRPQVSKAGSSANVQYPTFSQPKFRFSE